MSGRLDERDLDGVEGGLCLEATLDALAAVDGEGVVARVGQDGAAGAARLARLVLL